MAGKKYAEMSEEQRARHRERQREWYARNRDKARAATARCDESRKERDPDKVRAQARARQKRYYQKNVEKCRQRHREHQARRRQNNRDHVIAIKFKNQYGITIEARDAMFAAQGFVCAICKSDNPGSAAGWNTDHCHSTGVVRFILCAHCNRGLGAFKDNPEIMRRAADMLEDFYKKQQESADERE